MLRLLSDAWRRTTRWKIKWTSSTRRCRAWTSGSGPSSNKKRITSCCKYTMERWAQEPRGWRERLRSPEGSTNPRHNYYRCRALNSPQQSNLLRELTNWSEWEARWRASILFIGLTTSSLLAAISIIEAISSHSKAFTWKNHSISNATVANWKVNNFARTIWDSSGAQKLDASTVFACFAPFQKAIRQFFHSFLNCLSAMIWLGHNIDIPAWITSFAPAYTRKATKISQMNGQCASLTSMSTLTKRP